MVNEHYGTEGAPLTKTVLPAKIVGTTPLRVSQYGKFHGTISKIGPKGSV